MQLLKWGKRLARRLDAKVVQTLGWKDRDKIEVAVSNEQELGLRLDMRRERAIENLRNLGWNFPERFKFDRIEANER